MPHEPRSSPHNAETIADSSNQDGPRWDASSTLAKLHFIGRAGTLDMWLDEADPSMPFLIVYGPSAAQSNWARTPEYIFERCKRERVHLTLHNECMVHQLCEAHNPNKTKEHHQ